MTVRQCFQCWRLQRRINRLAKRMREMLREGNGNSEQFKAAQDAKHQAEVKEIKLH